MKRFKWMALLVLAVASVASAEATKKESSWHVLSEATMPATVLDEFPADSAGCLVVGHHILVDGRVDKARVMQGAFAAGTSAEVQKKFATAALSSVAGMRFEHRSSVRKPVAVFDWQTIGYASSATDGKPAFVVGVEQQDQRVREACRLTSLAEWSRRQPRPANTRVDEAKSQILASTPGSFAALWIIDEKTMAIPQYPPIAFESGIEACVLVGLIVDSSGKPDGFRILKAQFSGPTDRKTKQALENAALAALVQWRYVPGPDNLAGVPAFLQTPVDFALDRPSPALDCAPIDLSEPGSEGNAQ